MISRDSLKGITSVIAVGLAIFQIYFTAGFGIIDSQLLRTIHLGIVLALVFLYFPPKKLQEGEREHPGWLALDLVLICGAFATAYFLASDIDYYMERIRYVDPVSDAETVCATAAVLLVLEATRRVAGLPLVIVASAFLAYGLGGQYLPGILRHDGVTYKMLCEQLYLVTEGLYGIPLAVSSTMIFAFVMFGCFLQRAGLGQVFLDLACVLTRRSKGGPAKVSIFASALFGSISGSAVANLWDRINYQIVSPVSSPVKDLRDLKTMKNINIGVGSTGGSTEKIFRNILKEYGITYDDIKKNGGKVVTNGFDDIANMVKDGQIDVFVWIGPGEAWFIVDVSGSVPLKFLSIEPGIAKKVAAILGCNVGTLPAEFYKGKVGPDVTTLWDTNAIIVRDNLDEESAYRLTQAIIEGRDDIALANPAWNSIDPAKAWQGVVYPLHPGAVRYYKEKGYMN